MGFDDGASNYCRYLHGNRCLDNAVVDIDQTFVACVEYGLAMFVALPPSTEIDYHFLGLLIVTTMMMTTDSFG